MNINKISFFASFLGESAIKNHQKVCVNRAIGYVLLWAQNRTFNPKQFLMHKTYDVIIHTTN